LSVDYRFYPRKFIGKVIERYSKLSSEIPCVSFEGYQFRMLDYLVKIFNLPEIPYYYCMDDRIYNPLNIDFEFASFDLPNRDKYFILLEASCIWTDKEKERYQAYLDWLKWGLNKFNKITAQDILLCDKIPKDYRNSCIEELETMKSNIKKFLELYKEHWYKFSSV